MIVMTGRRLRPALYRATLLGSLVLAGCGPEMQARAVSRGTATPTGRLEDWHFGGRSMQPGYLYQRMSLGEGEPRSFVLATLAPPR